MSRSPGTWSRDQAIAAGVKGRAARAAKYALDRATRAEARRLLRTNLAPSDVRLNDLLQKLVTLAAAHAGSDKGVRLSAMLERVARALSHVRGAPADPKTQVAVPILRPLDP